MDGCIFCKIAAKELPSQIVYEDEAVIAIRDIKPQAPAHVVIMPKRHIADSAAGINEQNSGIVARIFEAIPKIAAKLELSGGFRVITNSGKDAAQSVGHLHFHLIGGAYLGDSLAGFGGGAI